MKIVYFTLIFNLFFTLNCATQYSKNSQISNASATSNLNFKLNDLTNQIVSNMLANKKNKIAVIELSDLEGRITELGKFLAEELITRLFLTKKFNVIERNLLNKVIEEHKLQFTGIIDPSAAKELGKILGVDAIATGTITDLGPSIRINLRLISTETGAIFAVAASEIIKNEIVKKLMENTPYVYNKKIKKDIYLKKDTGNLFVNGDFNQDLNIGWNKDIQWDNIDQAGTNWAKIEKGTLHIYHAGRSKIIISQSINVPNEDLIFSGKLKFSFNNKARHIAVAQMKLIYEDRFGKELGFHHWFLGTNYTPRYGTNDSPRQRTVIGKRGEGSQYLNWASSVDIADDISMLMIGINQKEIKKIKLVIEAMSSHRDGVVNIWIDEVKLTPKKY